jgi:uncharacterized protein YuzE
MEKAEELVGLVPYILKMPSLHIWIDYDKEVDVLYISFRMPQNANDSIIEGDIIYHYSGNDLVGATILHASEKARHI